MSTAEDVQQLEGRLAACVIARDGEGIRRTYRELLELGRSQQELIDEIIHVSTLAPDPRGTPPENLNLANSNDRDDELGSAALPHISCTAVDQSSHDDVTAANLGIRSLDYAEETKCEAVHQPGFSLFRRAFVKPLIIAALTVAASTGAGFVFIEGTASTPPIATAPTAQTLLDQTEVSGSVRSSWQLFGQTVDPNAVAVEALLSFPLLDQDELSTLHPGTAPVVSPLERGLGLGVEPVSSSPNVLRSVPRGARQANVASKPASRKLRRSLGPASNRMSSPPPAPETVATVRVGASTTGDLVGGLATRVSCPNGYVLYISACYPAR